MSSLLTIIVLDAPDSPTGWSKGAVVELMGKSHDARFVPTLLEILRDDVRYKSLQAEAAWALGEIGAPTALDSLKDAIAAGRLTRIQGIMAISGLAARSGDEKSGEYIASLLSRDDDTDVKLAALGALYSMPPNISQVLLKAVEQIARTDPSISVRVQAASRLFWNGHKEFLGVLKDASMSSDAGVRQEVVWAAGLSDETLSLVLDSLADPDTEVAAAAWTLLSKEMAEVDYATSPDSPEKGREMAKAYRKAWNESRHK